MFKRYVTSSNTICDAHSRCDKASRPTFSSAPSSRCSGEGLYKSNHGNERYDGHSRRCILGERSAMDGEARSSLVKEST